MSAVVDEKRGRLRFSSTFPVAALVLGLVLLAVGVGVLVPALAVGPWSEDAVDVEVGPEVPVTSMDQGLTPANNSPTIVVDPTEPRFVVLANRLDSPDFNCALQLSGNGGQSWAPVSPVPELPLGADKCYAPEVDFDRAGVLYYMFIGLTGIGNEPMGAFLTTSHDRGRTFTTPRQILGPGNFGVRMAINRDWGARGRIHFVWLHATSDPPLGGFGDTGNPILAAYSDDGGVTLSEPLQLSGAGRERVVAPALALGPDNAVHVAYYDLGADARDYHGLEGPTWEGTWSLLVSASTDGGMTFGPERVADDLISPSGRVMLIFTMPPPSLVASRNRTCLAWTDARYGDADALLRCSDDAGVSWFPPHRLNDDPLGNGRSQYQPRLDLSSDGRLDAVFYDRREDPSNERYHVYFTYSLDSGQHFARNIKLTHDSSDSQIGPAYAVVSAQGQIEFGSRMGLSSRPEGALVAWTDTRNSRAATAGQDIFSNKVRVNSRGSASTPKYLLGVSFLVGGLVSIALTFAWRRRITTGSAMEHRL